MGSPQQARPVSGAYKAEYITSFPLTRDASFASDTMRTLLDAKAWLALSLYRFALTFWLVMGSTLCHIWGNNLPPLTCCALGCPALFSEASQQASGIQQHMLSQMGESCIREVCGGEATSANHN